MYGWFLGLPVLCDDFLNIGTKVVDEGQDFIFIFHTSVLRALPGSQHREGPSPRGTRFLGHQSAAPNPAAGTTFSSNLQNLPVPGSMMVNALTHLPFLVAIYVLLGISQRCRIPLGGDALFRGRMESISEVATPNQCSGYGIHPAVSSGWSYPRTPT